MAPVPAQTRFVTVGGATETSLLLAVALFGKAISAFSPTATACWRTRAARMANSSLQTGQRIGLPVADSGTWSDLPQ
jgi:hypothetical protein